MSQRPNVGMGNRGKSLCDRRAATAPTEAVREMAAAPGASGTRRASAARGDANTTLLEKQKDDAGRREWSTGKHVAVAFGCLAGLWAFCWLLSALLIEALLRVTT